MDVLLLWYDSQEAKKGVAVAGKINVTPLEEKTLDDEPLVYATKLVRPQYVVQVIYLVLRNTKSWLSSSLPYVLDLGGKKCIQSALGICKCWVWLDLGSGNYVIYIYIILYLCIYLFLLSGFPQVLVHDIEMWYQAMKAIINDKRYGALKTLGERKQAFNEVSIKLNVT